MGTRDGAASKEPVDQKSGATHCCPSRHEIDFVEHVNQMLVRLLLPQVLDNRLAPCTERISSVQHVNDNVRRVEDLVQLSPYTSRGTFSVDGFTSSRCCWVIGVRGIKTGVGIC